MSSKRLEWAAKICCILDLIICTVIFGLSSYQFYSPKLNILFPEYDVMESWRTLVIILLCLSGSIICLSFVWFWAAHKPKRNKSWILVVVILSQLTAIIVGTIFSIQSYQLNKKETIDKETIFAHTQTAISNGINHTGDPMWIPEWLTIIQEESNFCCGIMTFNDWNTLWSPIKGHVPKSCCRSKDTSKCETDLLSIPFPDTVANNIKVDSGCHEEIRRLIRKALADNSLLMIITTIQIILTLVSFCILHLNAYTCSGTQCQNSGQLLQTEEQTWHILAFPEYRYNHGTSVLPAGATSDDSMIFDSENNTKPNTNGTVPEEFKSKDVKPQEKQISSSSQPIVTSRQEQTVPEIINNPLPEIDSDEYQRANTNINVDQSQPEPQIATIMYQSYQTQSRIRAFRNDRHRRHRY